MALPRGFEPLLPHGLALQVLALNLGHVDTRMVERHYAHLESEYVREQIVKNTASFTVDFEGADVVAIDKPNRTAEI